LVPAIQRSKRTLVFTNLREAGKRAAEILHAAGLSVAYIDGSAHEVKGEAYTPGRTVILRRFEARTQVSDRVEVVISPQVLDEGVDVPEAAMGIVLMGAQGRRQMIQRLGRILRKKEGKIAKFVVLCIRGTPEDPERETGNAGYQDFMKEVLEVQGKNKRPLLNKGRDWDLFDDQNIEKCLAWLNGTHDPTRVDVEPQNPPPPSHQPTPGKHQRPQEPKRARFPDWRSADVQDAVIAFAEDFEKLKNKVTRFIEFETMLQRDFPHLSDRKRFPRPLSDGIRSGQLSAEVVYQSLRTLNTFDKRRQYFDFNWPISLLDYENPQPPIPDYLPESILHGFYRHRISENWRPWHDAFFVEFDKTLKLLGVTDGLQPNYGSATVTFDVSNGYRWHAMSPAGNGILQLWRVPFNCRSRLQYDTKGSQVGRGKLFVRPGGDVGAEFLLEDYCAQDAYENQKLQLEQRRLCYVTELDWNKRRTELIQALKEGIIAERECAENQSNDDFSESTDFVADD